MKIGSSYFFMLPFWFLSFRFSNAQDNSQAVKRYLECKNRVLTELSPYTEEKRASLYAAMDSLGPAMYNCHRDFVIFDMDNPPAIYGKQKAVLIDSSQVAFPTGNWIMETYDLDNDHVAEAFGVLDSSDNLSVAYGLMFDLNKDGKYDYIVYHGGVSSTHDKQTYLYFYHYIDTDYDGKIDTWTSNAVNQPGDILPDPHNILWIHDNNNDGKVDLVQYIRVADGTTKRIRKDFFNDKWLFYTKWGRKQIDPNENFFVFENFLAEKITLLVQKKAIK